MPCAHILKGASKAYIFFPTHHRVASRRWVLYKWKYSKEHWQYHLQEMDLELLKGHWNNWVCIIVVYLDELCTFVPNITLCGEDAIDRSVKELLQPDDGISFSENQISQRALAAKKNGLRIVKATLRSIYCGLLLFGRFCSTSVILADICPVDFSLSLIPFISPIDVISAGNAAPE